MSDGDIAQARTMQGLGIKTGQIMKIFVLHARGYENVSFTSKDLYNKLDMARKEEIVDGDVQSTIGYLVASQDSDPLFLFKYNMDAEANRAGDRALKSLWLQKNGGNEAGTSKSNIQYSEAAIGDPMICRTKGNNEGA
ncbi:hypothetical protein M9H77_16189 [Catharanthus roseus]|uniref:Uncharacterized protein n=1 Tax=Catharanthus roseus TaxID=4058 RepID=A0ACC0B066_CATRO|nr:hypothetical protein M9H77_16189 [Catharanthus roseus]